MNGHRVTSRQRRRESAAVLLLPLCVLALLVPVFASRPAGDPVRLLVVALAAVCAFAAITARLVLRQSDARATGAAERLEATGHFRDSTQSIDALLHEPGYRREFVVELHTSALDDATAVSPHTDRDLSVHRRPREPRLRLTDPDRHIDASQGSGPEPRTGGSPARNQWSRRSSCARGAARACRRGRGRRRRRRRRSARRLAIQ